MELAEFETFMKEIKRWMPNFGLEALQGGRNLKNNIKV
jgi:hypothetical protein